MNILELLKTNYSQYKINDSSNRNLEQINKIIKICCDNPTIIVYMKRNEINDAYFRILEMLEHSSGIYDTEPIDSIVINKDNYVYIRTSEKNPLNILRCINKNLLNDEGCCICSKHKTASNESFPCSMCQTEICHNCFIHLREKKCPCCRNNYLKYGDIRK